MKYVQKTMMFMQIKRLPTPGVLEDLRAKTADPQFFQRQLSTPINLQLTFNLISSNILDFYSIKSIEKIL